MHKYFKPYLVLINILGLAILIIASLSYPIIINKLWFILLIFSVIAEILGVDYSSNKYVSLVGPLTIISLYFINISSALMLTVCVHTIVNLIRKYHHKDVDKFFNDQFFFNMFCIAISTGSTYLIYQLNIPLFGFKLLLMVITHNFVNYILVCIVIYLYTSDKKEAKFNFKQPIFYTFQAYMISLFTIIGYQDYSYLGILFVLIFITSNQTKMLTLVIGDELRDNLHSDTLTNAYNRNYLDKILADKLNHRVPFTILFMDFDKFKLINDTHGHLIGDKILVHFVQLLKEHLDKYGKIFRYGGDEFCIILNSPKDKTHIIEKLNKLKDSYHIDHDHQNITYSVTIGDYTYNGEKDIKSYQILEHVDKLMYEKK